MTEFLLLTIEKRSSFSQNSKKGFNINWNYSLLGFLGVTINFQLKFFEIIWLINMYNLSILL